MTHHVGTPTQYNRCHECFGKSFSDPTKEWHYPECSRYTEWRFGPRPQRRYGEAEQRKVAAGLRACGCPVHLFDGGHLTNCITGYLDLVAEDPSIEIGQEYLYEMGGAE